MEPTLYLDLHCHILPGIDDGSKTMDDTLALARRLVELGIPRVVATSHIEAEVYPNSRETLLPLVEWAQAHLDEVGIPLELVAGSEVRLDYESCRKDTWLTIGDKGRHLLVELSNAMPLRAGVENLLFSLQAQGVTPILAHPERHGFLRNDMSILEDWVSCGILTQGTMCALAGGASEPTVSALETFLSRGLIHFMGTDAHHVNSRLKGLDRAVARLNELVGEDNARLIRHQNPQSLLDGNDVLRPTPIAPPSKGLIERFFSAFKRG